jgi:hypothetical protein
LGFLKKIVKGNFLILIPTYNLWLYEIKVFSFTYGFSYLKFIKPNMFINNNKCNGGELEGNIMETHS